MAKADLIFYEKNYYQKKRYVLEAKIWQLDDKRYLGGVKFSLVFIDTKTNKKVLIDNHYPKGPHFHLDQEEFDYIYKDDSTLVQDFKNLIFQHFGVTI